jgi:hypothetical protein
VEEDRPPLRPVDTMLSHTSHRYVHGERSRDLVRAARTSPLAEVHPAERRTPLARLRARLRRAPEAAPARTFVVARSG